MQKKRREIKTNPDILSVIKEKGESMGELLLRVRKEYGIKGEEKVTFAGRLDPLASGVVLLLKNDARFEKEPYLSLSKEYEFEVILGIETDTHDVLGIITKIENTDEIKNLDEVYSTTVNSLDSLIGERLQMYPYYSSRKVKGKPLFEYARNNIETERPTRNISIFSLNLISVNLMNKEDFLNSVNISVGTVNGDFRQEDILSEWNKRKSELPERIPKIRCRVTCSSGTYVRVLATKVASLHNTVGIADNIYRVSVGEFTNI